MRKSQRHFIRWSAIRYAVACVRVRWRASECGGVRQSAVACVRVRWCASECHPSAASQPPLGRISATRRPHLSHPSAASQPPAGRILCTSAASRVAAGELASSSERAQVELGSRERERLSELDPPELGVRYGAVACGTVRWRAVACGGVRWGAVGCGSLILSFYLATVGTGAR